MHRRTASPSDAADAALVAAYLRADYRVRCGRRWCAVTPGERASAVERALPRADRFAILTAHNPGSRRVGARANHRAQQCLRRALQRLRLPVRPALAGADTRDWREPGFLLCRVSTATLDRLARRFGQQAVLFWRRRDLVRLRWYVDARRAVERPVAPALLR